MTRIREEEEVESQNKPLHFQPRNARQVKYWRAKTADCSKICRDAFVAVHELAFMLPFFMWSIVTMPDLVIHLLWFTSTLMC